MGSPLPHGRVEPRRESPTGGQVGADVGEQGGGLIQSSDYCDGQEDSGAVNIRQVELLASASESSLPHQTSPISKGQHLQIP